MNITSGILKALLSGDTKRKRFTAGEEFTVKANTSIKFMALEETIYFCLCRRKYIFDKKRA